MSDTEEKAAAARWFDGYVWINVRWEGRLSRGRGISQNLGKKQPGLPGTPVERQKASISSSAAEELCPWARRNMSESEPAMTLSFGDAIQLEWLTMAMLMALKLPLKMWKLSGLNNSRQSICDAVNYPAVITLQKFVWQKFWRNGGADEPDGWEASPRRVWRPDEWSTLVLGETSTIWKEWRTLPTSEWNDFLAWELVGDMVWYCSLIINLILF